MPQEDDSVSRQINLAEFAALRSEIINRSNLAWNIFALQLTAAGVIFSFALSNPHHTGFLLILPLTSYAFTGRYVSQHLGTQNVGTYIREVLDPKMNGELSWEGWIRGRPSQARALSWLNPLFYSVSRCCHHSANLGSAICMGKLRHICREADTDSTHLASRNYRNWILVSVDWPHRLTPLAVVEAKAGERPRKARRVWES